MTVSETTNSAVGSTNRMRLPCSPRMSTWPTHSATAHSDVGEQRGLPVGEAEVARCPSAWSAWAPATTQQDEEGAADEEPARALRPSEMPCVGDDVDEVAVAHVP